jgi:hypothetical protein
MKHVFIAVGGSGTKVAEALVRLLAVGFPTKNENNILTSAGDKLEIWRVDPDRSSGSAEDLRDCLGEYRQIQSYLSDGNASITLANSRWAMDIETNVRDLDPLDLPRADAEDNEIKTLRGVLDSQYGTSKSSLALLSPFFATKDLDVVIDRGFYQKPFIGSAVMSIFAKSLEDDSTPAGKKAGLTAYNNTPTNFFLCGSLHGGTGACGVPVMAQFLNRRKNENPGWGWNIGGCMLAPFVKPPNPPFQALAEGVTFTELDINVYLESFGNELAFQGLNEDEKRELVKQILLGFFADPNDMELRSRQGLTYYKDHTSDFFDELYLVGKPFPNQLKTWSNGGRTQKNPLNSADFVGAISALNFFSQANTGKPDSYTIGSSNFDIPQDNMRLGHLPTYKIGTTEIDAEKVLLSIGMANHLISHQIPWNKIKESARDFKICAYYEKRNLQKDEDLGFYQESLRIISSSIVNLMRPHNEQFPTGWSNEEAQQIWKFLSSDESHQSEVKANLGKKFMSKEAKGTNKLGLSEVKFTDVDFGSWCPEGDQFTRGEYLRHVWQEIYSRCTNQLGI